MVIKEELSLTKYLIFTLMHKLDVVSEKTRAGNSHKTLKRLFLSGENFCVKFFSDLLKYWN